MIAKAIATYLPPVLGLALIIFLAWATLDIHHRANRIERLLEQIPARQARCP